MREGGGVDLEKVWAIGLDLHTGCVKKDVKIICLAIKNLLEVIYPLIAQYIHSNLSSSIDWWKGKMQYFSFSI